MTETKCEYCGSILQRAEEQKSFTITKNHIPKRVNNPQIKIKPVGIILHYIGNPGTTAKQNANWFHSVTTQVSVHYIVDDSKIIELLSPDYKSYGTDKKIYNESYIQIEMCHPDSSGKISEKTLDNTIWLCKKLIAEYGLRDIIRHYDVTGKICPLYYVNNPAKWEELKNMIMPQMAAKYEVKNGMHVIRILPKDFKIRYWDKAKKTTAIKNYFNLGFFGVFSEQGENYTLPAANLCCDISEADHKDYVRSYLNERGIIVSGKLYLDCSKQFSDQFTRKKVSTLIIGQDNKAKIVQVATLPTDTKYAVSGAPVIVGGNDPSWAKYVVSEGWPSDITRATWHGFLGIDGSGEIVYVAMNTKTSNCIQSSEAYTALKALGLRDAIMLDGGGSFVLDKNGKNVAVTSENRRINTIGLF